MRERLKVWLILFLVAVAAIVYAIIPQTITIGKFKLAKLNLSALHIGNVINSDSIPDEDTTKKGFVNGVDTTHQVVLFFGDSMTSGICQRLDDYCHANGHKLYTITWYSSTTEKFANTNTLDTYIRLYHPTYFIVCLGSNELFVRDIPTRREYIKDIISKFGGKPFVWVSPPNWKRDTGIDSLIHSCVGDKRFFNSSRLNLDRASDHIHPTISGSAKWADAIAAWLRNSKLTAHPITMSAPKVHYSSSYDVYTPMFNGFTGNDNPVRHRHFGGK